MNRPSVTGGLLRVAMTEWALGCQCKWRIRPNSRAASHDMHLSRSIEVSISRTTLQVPSALCLSSYWSCQCSSSSRQSGRLRSSVQGGDLHYLRAPSNAVRIFMAQIQLSNTGGNLRLEPDGRCTLHMNSLACTVRVPMKVPSFSLLGPESLVQSLSLLQ